jgi:hypothetical protein
VSDDGASLESEVAAEVGPESGDTEVEATEPTEPAPPEPARQYVEVDDPDNRYERVKVQGEDVEVPYSELVKGYSREADYTRKAQEVAQMRAEAEYGLRLQQALQANPQLTLQILAEQLGGSQPAETNEPEPELEFTDPLERMVYEERQARLDLEDRLAQRDADQQLEQAIGGLKTQLQLDDDTIREVVGVAYKMGYGTEAFPMIAKTIAYDRLSARVQAARQREAERVAEEQRRIGAKAAAGEIIGNGTGAVGVTNQVEAGGHMNLRDAIEAAVEQAERASR